MLCMTDNGPVCKEPVYRREISEDITPGTHVASVVSWDADEGTAARSRYILTGEGAQHFSIDQLSGHVATASQLDRETQDHYHLTVSTCIHIVHPHRWHMQSFMNLCCYVHSTDNLVEGIDSNIRFLFADAAKSVRKNKNVEHLVITKLSRYIKTLLTQ